MRVAFAGPPDYPDLDKVRERVRQLSPGDTVLYFNRRGALYRALRDAARERGLRTCPTFAAMIHVTCDRAVVFAGDDRVADVVIDTAKRCGIPLEIIGAGSTTLRKAP